MNSSSNGESPRYSGSRLTDELRLLLDALADRAQPWLNRMAAEADGKHLPSTCEWCPLCAVLAMLNGQRPELAIRAAEHAAGLLAVLRAALAPSERSSDGDDHEENPEADPTDDVAGDERDCDERDGGTTAPEAGPRRVQRIELRRRTGLDTPGS